MMKFLVFFLLSVVLSADENCEWDYGVPNEMNLKADTDQRRGLIVDGEESTPHEYPWQVKLAIDGYTCGGSIIGSRWVLTAAHCGVRGANPVVHAGLGTVSIQGKFIWHENYDDDALTNDIALIRLDEPLPCDNPHIKAISLADKRSFDINGCSAWITGFGTLYSDGPMPEQKFDNFEVQTKIFDTDACNAADESFYKELPQTQLCGFTPGKPSEDSCQGDSGGPFIIDTDTTATNHVYTQAGVVSYGNGCGTTAGVYTDVSEYREWILKHYAEAEFTSVTQCDKQSYQEGIRYGCESDDCVLQLPPCEGDGANAWRTNAGESCTQVNVDMCFATKGADSLFAYQVCHECKQCVGANGENEDWNGDANNKQKSKIVTADTAEDCSSDESLISIQFFTGEYANEVSFQLVSSEEDFECAGQGFASGDNGETFDITCCLKQQQYTLQCMDNYGDGYGDATITIAGTAYCQNFNNGNMEEATVTIGGDVPNPSTTAATTNAPVTTAPETTVNPEVNCDQCTTDFIAISGLCDNLEDSMKNPSAGTEWLAQIPETCGSVYDICLPSVVTACGITYEEADSVCFALATMPTTYANEMSWTFGNGICEGSLFSDNTPAQVKCCVEPNTQHTLECKDSYGDGWHGGYLQFLSVEFCKEFDAGNSYVYELTILSDRTVNIVSQGFGEGDDESNEGSDDGSDGCPSQCTPGSWVGDQVCDEDACAQCASFWEGGVLNQGVFDGGDCAEDESATPQPTPQPTPAPTPQPTPQPTQTTVVETTTTTSAPETTTTTTTTSAPEVVEADCSETEAELETCNSNLATARELLSDANEAVSECQSQLPVSQTVHTYQDVLADCLTPTGDWMFNTATQTDVAKTFCVVNNEFVVVENDRTYPTCVQYNPSNSADCDQDNFVCGEMVGDTQGWPNQVKGQLNVALQRADYKHHECPTIQDNCGKLSEYWRNFVRDNTVFSADESMNVCVGSNMLRVVQKEHYADTCVGFSEEAREDCPADRSYICSGNNAGSLVYGWPGQIIATLGAALSNAAGDYRHPQCAGLLP